MQNGAEIAGAGGVVGRTPVMGPRRFIPFLLVIVLTVAAAITAVLSASTPAGGSTGGACGPGLDDESKVGDLCPERESLGCATSPGLSGR